MDKRIVEKFALNANSASGCWLWSGTLNDRGYGVISIGQESKKFKAHRISYALFNYGRIPTEHVLHRCDNPRCVNPDHLFLGTQLDNIADQVAKGRRPRDNGRFTSLPNPSAQAGPTCERTTNAI